VIYLDSSYLVRLYIRQPGSDAVVAHLTGKAYFVCCAHGRPEVVSALKRQQREGSADARGVRAALAELARDESARLLAWLPIEPALITFACEKMASLPPGVFLRAADALHLACAAEAGCKEIYSHDRHLLAAAPHFGLRGLDVISPTKKK